MDASDQSHGVFEHVFTTTEMERVLDRLTRARVERTRAGARHLLGVTIVRELADDARMTGIARVFVGPAAVPFRATLFDKSSSANWLIVWHQDTALPLRGRVESAEWGPWSTKAGVLYAHAPAWALEQIVALRVNLDDSLETNGPLRVLPGTHREGILAEARIEQLAREIAPVHCVAPAGSVVAMRPLTVHASSKATTEHPRRVLHVEYAPAVELGCGIYLAMA